MRREIRFFTMLLWAGAPVFCADSLPGTKPLAWQEELDVKMMDGAHRFVERKIEESQASREKHWHRDLSSRAAYEASVEPNRGRFREKIGVVDARVPPGMERFGDEDNPAPAAETESFRVYQVRWPVLDGVHGEGLLLEPKRAPAAVVIALPDADETPEQVAGRFAQRLAEQGCTVLIPTLIDRTARWLGRPDIRMTDQPHREWIYRQAFHMGRHVIGYEVQKVLAAVDWFKGRNAQMKIAVAGYGEGGLIAFYAAAADTRIDAALVSGYFNTRQQVWAEPIFRNVWGLLEEFGDAEIATLIAPRPLVVEYAKAPEFKSTKGDLAQMPLDTVTAEFRRIDRLTRPGFQPKTLVTGPSGVPAGPGSPSALRALLGYLGLPLREAPAGAPLEDRRKSFDPAERQKRQVKELEAHVQGLIRESDRVRNKFFLDKLLPEDAEESWSMKRRHDSKAPDAFVAGTKWYRDYFYREAIGKFEEPPLAPNPRTRKIQETDKWTAYDVVLDVWPEVFAWGVLLVPKDLRPGERRPVVVCQHGRDGLPRVVIEPSDQGYYALGARLADQGFIVFAPHNLYRGEDRYRWLSRKANGVKASLFSFIIAQHDQILRWLQTLPFVDGKRMAFYGLSYGGESAVRIPAVLEKYCLSICSGDFNQWTRKVASTDQPFSFMYTIEWEMPYFNLGSTFDYAEMAYLIFPRPFMVERGRHDIVGRDWWVAYEYAKVSRLYTLLSLPDLTRMEFFNGGHAINAEGSFDFLHKHLEWPPSAPSK